MNTRLCDSDETTCLLKSVRSGRRDVLGELLERHRPYLLAVLRGRIGPKLRRFIDMSDVIQSAELQALESLDRYLAERPVPFRLWLRRAAYDQLHRVCRRADRGNGAREVQLGERSGLWLDELALANQASPSQELRKQELADQVHRLLAQLSEQDREILLLRHFENLPYDQIAFLLRIRADAARKRYGRALLRLDKLLRTNHVSDDEP